MVNESVTHIRCPGCEFAVRDLNDTPCPNCRRCAFCGRKLDADNSHCNCDFAEDPNGPPRFLTGDIIPEEQVARETERMEIRKQLRTAKGIADGLMGGMLVVAGSVYREIFGGFSWTTLGVYLVCVGIVFMLLQSSVKWVFLRIEEHRLQNGDRRFHES